jgi:hypothetical protein
LTSVEPFGTIALMKQHRARLTDKETGLILSALRARLAMAGKQTRRDIERLIERLEEMEPGNPEWRFGYAAERLATEDQAVSR